MTGSPSDSLFSHRMRNWARYIRGGGMASPNTCQSAEALFVLLDPERTPSPRPIGYGVDVNDGELVRRCMAAAVQLGMLTREEAWALTFNYVYSRSLRSKGFQWKAARRCRVWTPAKLARFVTQTEDKFTRVLAFLEQAATIRSTKQHPTP